MKRPERMSIHRVFSLLLVSLLGQTDFGLAQENAHPACHTALAGAVSRAVMERPVALADRAGHLHQQVSTTSAEAQAYYDQGFAYLASYVWIEAARSFHEALRRDPELAMAQLGLAKAYTGAEAVDDARFYLQKASDLAAQGKVTAKEAKWIALGQQQVDALTAPAEERAAKHQAYKQGIEELIALDPEDPHAWVLRGNAEEPGAWGRGQVGGVGSIAYYEAALRRDPENLAAHHFLIHSYENIGRHALAAEHGQRYAAAAPGVPHAQHMYGHVLPRVGKWREALTQLSAADRLEREYYAAQGIAPEEDWHHGHNLHLLGIVHLRLGNVAEAERLFQEDFRLADRGLLAGAYGAPWVEYLLLRGRFAEALTAAQEVEGRPAAAARIVGAALGGEALLALGRLEDAQRAQERAAAAHAELVRQVQNTYYEAFAARFMRSFLNLLEGELALRGENAGAGEARLITLADELAANPRVDAWAVGLFNLQRLAADARRAGNPQLATALTERMRRIDPDFTPDETTTASVSTEN
jgi:tetratricopeptide (TPR) repeat protein